MLCTRARAAGGGSLMNFNFLTPSSRPTETVGPLPSALQRWVDTPQSGQVEGCGGQRQFPRHLRQPAPTEAPHPALLFQHPDHRLHDRFPSLVDRAPGGAAQLLPHPTMHRVADRSASAHACSPIQFACQRGVWHIGVDATLASSTTPLKVKKPLSALTCGGRSPQRCLTASTVGTSAALSVGACVTRCSTVRWSSLTATVTVYPSVKPLRSRKKRLSGSVSEARVRPALRNCSSRRGISCSRCWNAAMCSGASCWPAASCGSLLSHCRCQRRIC